MGIPIILRMSVKRVVGKSPAFIKAVGQCVALESIGQQCGAPVRMGESIGLDKEYIKTILCIKYSLCSISSTEPKHPEGCEGDVLVTYMNVEVLL